MKKILKLIAFIIAFALIPISMVSAQTVGDNWLNQGGALFTNTGNGLANADIHVAHCYIGTGTGTPCGGGGGGTIGGSIAINQIAFGSAANTITGSANDTIDTITGFPNLSATVGSGITSGFRISNNVFGFPINGANDYTNAADGAGGFFTGDGTGAGADDIFEAIISKLTAGNTASLTVDATGGIKLDSGSAPIQFANDIWPANDGTSGQAIVTDGAGHLSFASMGGSVYPSTLIPFGDGSTAGGVTDSSLSYALGSSTFTVLNSGSGNGRASQSQVQFLGTGASANEITTYIPVGFPSGVASITYVVTVDGNGTPDTFSWTDTQGGSGSGIAMTGSAQALSDGTSWSSDSITTGHVIGDTWTWTVYGEPLGIVNASNYESNGDPLISQFSPFQNVSVGDYASLPDSGSGSTGFTAVGFQANTGTGTENVTSVGDNAGTNETTSGNDTYLGANTAMAFGQTYFDSTALGQGASISLSDQLALGSTVRNLFIGGVNLKFPNTQGSALTFLENDGSGNLSWSPATGLIGSTSGVTSSSTPGSSTETWLGNLAGSGGSSAVNTSFFGDMAAVGATSADNSSFFGYQSGLGATNADSSVFFGGTAGYQATNADHATFIGPGAGQSATNAEGSTFIGLEAGLGAGSAKNSTFIGGGAGGNALTAANSIFIGDSAGASDTVDDTVSGSNILIGNSTNTGGFQNSIALGTAATNTSANQFLIPSSYIHIQFNGLATYANNAAAITGGLVAGDEYLVTDAITGSKAVEVVQ